MCQIYYPFFYAERVNQNKKYNHKLYLFLFSLFCDKILIPARHLLEIGNDSFDILLDNHELFDRGVVFSRIPTNCENLNQYYQGIKRNISGRSNDFKDIRIDKILTNLYHGINTFKKYDPIDQQEYFSEQIHAFVCAYADQHKPVKGMDKIKEKCSQRIPKEEFDAFLKQCRSKNDITKETYKKLNEASEIIYFLAGASTHQLTVCYDKSLDTMSIQSEMSQTINNYGNILNKHYAPDEIISLLKNLGVIDQEKVLENLTMDDIFYLRNQTCFKKFIHKYDHYASTNSFDDFFRKERSVFKTICKIKSGILSFLVAIFVSLVMLIFRQTIWTVIVWTVVSLLLVAFVTYFIQTKWKYEIPIFEGLLDKLIGYFDPVSLYLAKLRWRIISNHLSPS